MFVLSFKNGNDDPTRDYFDNKPFFDQPVKNKREAYEKLIEMSRNNDYTAGNLLDYLYHQRYSKLIGIDLWWKTNTSITQQINFVGKLEDDSATIFFIAEKQNYSELFSRFINCNRII